MSHSLSIFQSQLSSVMDILLKTAICEITKLAEDSFTNFQLEIAQSKQEKADLQLRVQVLESEMRAGRPYGLNTAGHNFNCRCVQVQAAEQEMPRNTQGATPEAYDLCDVGETIPIEQQHYTEKGRSNLKQDTETTLLCGKGRLNEQHQIKQNVNELKGLRPVHMAVPGPEHVTQRHNPTGTQHGRVGLNNLDPENITESPNILQFLIKQEQTEVDLGKMDILNITEQHFEFELNSSAEQHSNIMPVQITLEEGHEELHGSGTCLETLHSDRRFFDSVHIKEETETNSGKFEDIRIKQEHSQLERTWGREELLNREQHQAKNIPLQRFTRCSIDTVTSLQHLDKSTSTHSPLTVSENTAELTGNPEDINYCVYCKKSFQTAWHLKVHQRTHTKDRPHSCHQCGKGFSETSKLKSHLLIHTGEKPYSCAQCGKSFRQSGTLKSHQKLHTGERPYQCDHCKKHFITSGQLTVHYRIHTGEKPYTCSQCGKSFIRSTHLKSHLHTHIGRKL
ncbi:zinc finger and SCAN domain-containing protein 32 [Amia ocellicauda]|uniref:zinc finger and SCAN domain-containing protein 32 n=1 Tax=Amia ocellicauda TaxID=2972642 RepID=UPI003463E3A7